MQPGDTVSHYRIDARLGSGGMGVVFLAEDLTLGRKVALKFLSSDVTRDATTLERFRREARAASALHHPHICTIFEIGDDDGRPFIAMEFIEGRPLSEYAAGRALPVDEVLKVGLDVADALDAAHRAGIVHRDIKPANIFITPQGRAKLLDFGLAKFDTSSVAAASVLPTTPGAARLTSPGATLGTVAYMSPEQARGEALDARSDLFSFGVTLYEMSSGKLPFDGPTSAVIFHEILSHTPPPVSASNPDLPNELDAIIGKALEKDRETRAQSAAEIRADLKRLARSRESHRASVVSSGSRAVAASTDRPSDAQIAVALLKKHRRRVGAAVVLGVMAIVAGVYAWNRFRSTAPLASDRPASNPWQNFEVVPITTSGEVSRPAVSPDGKYVVFARRGEILMRQIATGSEVLIVPRSAGLRDPGGGITITPDGTYVDFLANGPSAVQRQLWRVPLIGGEPPHKLFDDVSGSVGWSRAGTRMAFVRDLQANGGKTLMVADRDGSNLRPIARGPFSSLAGSRPSIRPAWSQDDRLIAVPGGGNRGELLFVDVTTGTMTPLPIRPTLVFGLDWLTPGELAVNQASEDGAPNQLWLLTYPDGAISRITNDLSSYVGVSLSFDRKHLVTARQDRTLAISIADATGTNERFLVSGMPSPTRAGGPEQVTWAGDRLLFMSSDSGHQSISEVPVSGGKSRVVISQATDPAATSDGRTIVYASSDPEKRGLWKATDGGIPKQIYDGKASHPIILDDDRRVAFAGLLDNRSTVLLISIDGGTVTKAADYTGVSFDISRDGTSVLMGSRDEQNQNVTIVCDLPGCTSSRPLQDRSGTSRWAHNGRDTTFTPFASPLDIWLRPLNGPPRKLTNFVDNRPMADYEWSPDGKQLAILRTSTTSDAVLFSWNEKPR